MTWRSAVVLFGLGLVVGIIAGGGLVLLLHLSHETKQVVPESGRAFTPVPEPDAGQLAERFRPWLMFDSGEPWRPQSIESLLGERLEDGRPAQRFCTRSGGSTDCRRVADLRQFENRIARAGALGNSTYLDIAGKDDYRAYRAPSRSALCARKGLLDCDDTKGSAIYYHVIWSNRRYYIDYWWFLRYNHFALTDCHGSFEGCDEHEGDWEGVTLVTAPEDRSRLDYVVYATHKSTFRYPAAQLDRQAGRPMVFVADGSHASYPLPCSGACRQPITFHGLVYLPEEPTDGKRPWARNAEACPAGVRGSCLLPLPAGRPGRTAWTTWPGLWGETCGERCARKAPQSPASPGLQTRYQTPWCSTQSGTVTCDTAAPGCSDWLGPLVSVLACNPAAVTGGLRAPEDLGIGDLRLVVKSGRDATPFEPTVRGIVQALGKPLKAGAVAIVRNVGPSTQVLVRAEAGGYLVETHFEPPPGDAAAVFRVEARTDGQPVVRGAERGAPVPPVEVRRTRLAPAG